MSKIKRDGVAISDEDFAKHMDSGYKEVQEGEFQVDSRTFFEATMKRIIETEVPHMFYGHRSVWRNLYKSDVYTLPKVLKACGRELVEYARYKTGHSPAGTCVPSGVDDEGHIVKPLGPCIITGSGPSFNDLEPLIKHWKGGIISSANAQAGTLRYYGAHPSHVLLFDSQANDRSFRRRPLDRKKTIVLTHPGIDPNVNNSWRGQKYWYRVYSPNNMEMSEIQRMAYDFIRTEHYPFSCALAGQMSFAHAMGYDPLIFVGADLAFTEEKARFDMWEAADLPSITRILRTLTGQMRDIQKRFKWTEVPGEAPETGNKKTLLIRTKSGFLTHYIHLFYSVTAMSCYWLDTPNIIDCSNGLLTDLLPKGNLEDIIRNQGRGLEHLYKTREEIREWIEPWLASRGTFYIQLPAGHKLVETKNWEPELPMFLEMLKKEFPDIDAQALFDHCAEMVRKGPSMPYGCNTIIPEDPNVQKKVVDTETHYDQSVPHN